jgi:hypothetical protein
MLWRRKYLVIILGHFLLRFSFDKFFPNRLNWQFKFYV